MKRHVSHAKQRKHDATLENRPLILLEEFSSADLPKWNAASKDLDDLVNVLYFHLETDRRRYRGELLAALKAVTPIQWEINNWCRLVDYQYSDEPLSCEGSLRNAEGGGRFNVGVELDGNPINCWPALYIAENNETAYREKFQIEKKRNNEGLTGEELALGTGSSIAYITLSGKLQRVFDLRSENSLIKIAKIFAKIKMPQRARDLTKRLKLSREVKMLTTPQQLFDCVVKSNWRVSTVQYGLPSQSKYWLS